MGCQHIIFFDSRGGGAEISWGGNGRGGTIVLVSREGCILGVGEARQSFRSSCLMKESLKTLRCVFLFQRARFIPSSRSHKSLKIIALPPPTFLLN